MRGRVEALRSMGERRCESTRSVFSSNCVLHDWNRVYALHQCKLWRRYCARWLRFLLRLVAARRKRCNLSHADCDSTATL
jgi:hypothetical protein